MDQHVIDIVDLLGGRRNAKESAPLGVYWKPLVCVLVSMILRLETLMECQILGVVRFLPDFSGVGGGVVFEGQLWEVSI